MLSDSGRWLFAVNAGSDEISIFGVRGDQLRLLDVVPSGGGGPISLASIESIDVPAGAVGIAAQ